MRTAAVARRPLARAGVRREREPLACRLHSCLIPPRHSAQGRGACAPRTGARREVSEGGTGMRLRNRTLFAPATAGALVFAAGAAAQTSGSSGSSSGGAAGSGTGSSTSGRAGSTGQTGSGQTGAGQSGTGAAGQTGAGQSGAGGPGQTG